MVVAASVAAPGAYFQGRHEPLRLENATFRMASKPPNTSTPTWMHWNTGSSGPALSQRLFKELRALGQGEEERHGLNTWRT